jgi:hypothetical protein
MIGIRDQGQDLRVLLGNNNLEIKNQLLDSRSNKRELSYLRQ